MQDLTANLAWYAAGAFALGFVVAWLACGEAEAAAHSAPMPMRGRRTTAPAVPLGWLWRGYRAYDKGAGWWDRIGWFLGLFKTNAGVAMLVASTGAAATYGAIEIRKQVIEPLKVETAAIAPEAEVRQTRNSTVFAIEGKDKAGRRGTFDVVVLNKSFLWVRGSAEDLEKDGAVIPRADLAAAVLDDEVKGALADAKEVITVGTASQEGNAAEEVARAERRAKQAATLISGAVAAATPIWTLNLGQYRDPCTNCETGGTSWQRPFIVIAVKETDPGTNIGEALDRRHERQGEAAEPVELLRLRPHPLPLAEPPPLPVDGCRNRAGRQRLHARATPSAARALIKPQLLFCSLPSMSINGDTIAGLRRWRRTPSFSAATSSQAALDSGDMLQRHLEVARRLADAEQVAPRSAC